MKCRGQASLEFLVLFAALLAVIIAFFPAVARVSAAGQFGLDVRNAKLFLQEVRDSVEVLGALGSGSQRTLQASPSNTWTLGLEGKRLYLEVFSEKLGKSKSLELETSFPASPKTFSFKGKSSFVLRRGNSEVSVEQLDP